MQYEEYKVPTYPVVQFLVRRGLVLAGLLGLMPLLVGLYLTIVGGGWIPVSVGLVAGVLLGGLLISYVEVLKIIADTLIPK